VLSGRGSNFQAIAEAGLPIEIVAVISNRPGAGLDYGARAACLLSRSTTPCTPDREVFDALLADEMNAGRSGGAGWLHAHPQPDLHRVSKAAC
jgi:phosphoribosylglycinamide formyltransferase-1